MAFFRLTVFLELFVWLFVAWIWLTCRLHSSTPLSLSLSLQILTLSPTCELGEIKRRVKEDIRKPPSLRPPLVAVSHSAFAVRSRPALPFFPTLISNAMAKTKNKRIQRGTRPVSIKEQPVALAGPKPRIRSTYRPSATRKVAKDENQDVFQPEAAFHCVPGLSYLGHEDILSDLDSMVANAPHALLPHSAVNDPSRFRNTGIIPFNMTVKGFVSFVCVFCVVCFLFAILLCVCAHVCLSPPWCTSNSSAFFFSSFSFVFLTALIRSYTTDPVSRRLTCEESTKRPHLRLST